MNFHTMQINELSDKDINTEQLHLLEKLFYRNRWFCSESLTTFHCSYRWKEFFFFIFKIDVEVSYVFTIFKFYLAWDISNGK